MTTDRELLEAAERDRLTAEVAALKTVMVAAAEEIHAHWQAHCDAEGYGPQNLMRRLEEGIPSEYGYTAGAFAKLTAEVATLRSTVDRMLSVARARAAYEASAAVHHAGRWHNAFEHHTTRLAAMRDVIAAIEAAHKEPR